MKPQNGFNKKQKEEIQRIVRNEINEAFKKYSNMNKPIENEVKTAIYSILKEKNEEFINELLEFNNKVDEKEAEKDDFAKFIKKILYISCVMGWIVLFMYMGAVIYVGYTKNLFTSLQGSLSVLIILMVLILFMICIFAVWKSIKSLNKSDSYNILMFLMTVLSLILAVCAMKA